MNGLSLIDLLLWLPNGSSSNKILLPKKPNETEQAAVDRYVESLKQGTYRDIESALLPDRLSDLFSKKQLEELRATKSNQKFETPLRSLDKPFVAMIANSSEDLLSGERISRNVQMFERLSTQPVIIALGADIGLNDEEQTNFRFQVAEQFDLLVALGGDDVTPEIYKEPNVDSKSTNLQRDLFELGLIKIFKNRAKGFFFGICRGHQLGAIADGHSMHQEISKIPNASVQFHHPCHQYSGPSLESSTEILPTLHENLFVGQSLLRNFIGVVSQMFEVNSRHHQAINYNRQGRSRIVAISAENLSEDTGSEEYLGQIVEALEQTNGLGLSVQWHPEFFVSTQMKPEIREIMERLMQGIVKYAFKVSRGG